VLSLFWAPPGAGLLMWRPDRKDFAVLKVRQRIVVMYETGAFSVRLGQTEQAQTAQYMCTGLVDVSSAGSVCVLWNAGRARSWATLVQYQATEKK
jgi:hypothetical protein